MAHTGTSPGQAVKLAFISIKPDSSTVSFSAPPLPSCCVRLYCAPSKLIAELFNSTKFINDSDIKISNRERDYFLNLMNTFLNKILGINFDDSTVSKNDSILEVLKEVRDEARINKNYDLSDKIRDKLSNIGVNLNDKD